MPPNLPRVKNSILERDGEALADDLVDCVGLGGGGETEAGD